MRTLPLRLAEAVISLYPEDAEGNAVTASPVWIGARVEGVELDAQLEEVESTPSGAASREFEPLGELHHIRIERIWVLSAATLSGSALARGRFVLEILTEDRRLRVWHRRTYFGVTMLSNRLRSQGLMHYGEQQEFRARRYVEASGPRAST